MGSTDTNGEAGKKNADSGKVTWEEHNKGKHEKRMERERPLESGTEGRRGRRQDPRTTHREGTGGGSKSKKNNKRKNYFNNKAI